MNPHNPMSLLSNSVGEECEVRQMKWSAQGHRKEIERKDPGWWPRQSNSRAGILTAAHTILRPTAFFSKCVSSCLFPSLPTQALIIWGLDVLTAIQLIWLTINVSLQPLAMPRAESPDNLPKTSSSSCHFSAIKEYLISLGKEDTHIWAPEITIMTVYKMMSENKMNLKIFPGGKKMAWLSQHEWQTKVDRAGKQSFSWALNLN